MNDQDHATSGEEKKPRHRSPNYPAVGLREACDRAAKFYRMDGKAGAPPQLAAVHIGFSKPHGQAMSVLAALKKFGLVTESNGRIILTQRGLEIVNLPSEDPRRAQALREAVLSPPIYQELIDQHKDTGWPSDDVVERELVTYRNFNPNAVKDFVADLRDSLEFAGLSSLIALESGEEDEFPPMQDSVQVRTAADVAALPAMASRAGGSGAAARIVKELLSQRVSPDCVVQVIFDGPVTQKAVEKLIAHLELAKDNYPNAGE
jgi:hypothetical protein